MEDDSLATVGGPAGAASGCFGGMELANVCYVASRRDTHSDVLSTVTTLVQPDAMDGPLMFQQHKQHQRKVKVSLSIPAAKLNRELQVERKLFGERLYRERLFRYQVESGAASMVQAMVRGKLTRERLAQGALGDAPTSEASLDARDEDSSQLAVQRPWGKKRPRARPLDYVEQAREHSKIRKHLAYLQRLTERRVGNRLGDSKLMLKTSRKRRPQYAASRKKQHQHAIRMQRLVRRFLAWRHAQVLRQYNEEERLRDAVITIQAHFRAYHGRKKKLSREMSELAMAVIKIQANVRRHLDCRFVERVRVHLRRAMGEAGAVIKLQKFLRAKAANRRVVERRIVRASTVVQAGYRGYHTRAIIEQRKIERRESAIKLQSALRGHLCRRSMQVRQAMLDSMREGAAVSIQRVARGNSARRIVSQRHKDAAATAIQAQARRRLARNRVRRLQERRKRNTAAVRIQSSVRRKTALRRVGEVKVARRQDAAAVRIQTVHRGKQARHKRRHREEERRQGAATKLQCAQRARVARKSVSGMRQDRAAQRIQRGVRAKMASDQMARRRQELRDQLMHEADDCLAGASVRQARGAATVDDQDNNLHEQVEEEQVEDAVR